MSDTIHNLYPNITKIVKLVGFKYDILELKLFESLRVAVYLFDENNNMIKATQFLIEGEEYKAWGDDDKYIVNLLRNKLQTLSYA